MTSFFAGGPAMLSALNQRRPSDTFFDEFRDPAWAPPPLLKRMVLAGHLGVKSGKGFYEYDENGKRKP